MVNNEPLVTSADLAAIDLDTGSGQLREDVASLFEKEPKLAETSSRHWERLENLFKSFGLTPVQQAALTKQIVLMLSKPLVLLDRAHRRQWDDVLPS